MLSGLLNLAKMGQCHGDLKWDNFLVVKENGKLSFKVSDFGKTVALREWQTKRIGWGNTRFMPPENTLSQPSQVYSAAILIVGLLNKLSAGGDQYKMLVTPDPAHTKPTPPIEKRQGFERYRLMNDAYICHESHNETEGVGDRGRDLNRASRFKRGDPLRYAQADFAYLTALRQDLVQKANTLKAPHLQKAWRYQAEELCDLLEKMMSCHPSGPGRSFTKTDLDPSERPSMAKAVYRYTQISEEMQGILELNQATDWNEQIDSIHSDSDSEGPSSPDSRSSMDSDGSISRTPTPPPSP
jgi:hypothetical protein